jgi:hypothetical protein
MCGDSLARLHHALHKEQSFRSTEKGWLLREKITLDSCSTIAVALMKKSGIFR